MEVPVAFFTGEITGLRHGAEVAYAIVFERRTPQGVVRVPRDADSQGYPYRFTYAAKGSREAKSAGIGDLAARAAPPSGALLAAARTRVGVDIGSMAGRVPPVRPPLGGGGAGGGSSGAGGGGAGGATPIGAPRRRARRFGIWSAGYGRSRSPLSPRLWRWRNQTGRGDNECGGHLCLSLHHCWDRQHRAAVRRPPRERGFVVEDTVRGRRARSAQRRGPGQGSSHVR